MPLSEGGRKAVSSWRLDVRFHGWRCFCSPLGRARETAALMQLEPNAEIDALQEMEWGQWEGHTLRSLRAIDPMAFTRNEDRGLDFRPPGGESPREVRTRLHAWITTLTESQLPAIAVCHKGVLRAALSLATQWDMKNDPPEKLRDATAHLYRINRGHLSVEELNIPLTATPRPSHD